MSVPETELESLERLVTLSREWTQCQTKEELFQAAAQVLRQAFQVEMGYFVYRVGPVMGIWDDPLKVYEPWGVFRRLQDDIQARVDQQASDPLGLAKISERWMSIDQTPDSVRADWKEWGVVQGGSWKLTFRDERVGAVVLRRGRPFAYDDSKLISLCALQISLVLELLTTRSIAEDASRRDLLTGLSNRRGVMDQLEDVLTKAELRGEALMVGIIDVDDFKHINDSYGHLEGDHALQEIACLIRKHLRDDDVVGRWGGDEFAVVIRADLKDWHGLAERLEDKISRNSYSATVSCGFAVWHHDGNTWNECYEVADQRLYTRKASRRLLSYRSGSN